MTDGRDPFAAASSPFGQGACKLFQTNRPSPKSKILYLLRRIAIHLDFQTSSAATIPPTNNKIGELKGEENTHLIFQCRLQFQTSPHKWTFSEEDVSLFGETNILLIHFQVTLDTYSRGDRPKMFFVLSVLLAQILILEDFALVTQVDKVYICSILYIYTNITNLKTPGMPIHFWEDFPIRHGHVSMKFTQILCNISSYLARTIFSQSDLNKPGVIFIGPKRGWKHPAPRCNIRFFVVKVI